MHDAGVHVGVSGKPDTAVAAAARLREILRSTLPLCSDLVAECCRAERIDQRLATILEDFGQDFIGLSYPINAAAYAQSAARKAERRRRRTGDKNDRAP